MILADYLRASKKALIFTGAGISTDSGIPDFRGPQGVWTRRQPVYFQDFMTSEAARIEHWDYKLEGRDAFRDARPNAIHYAIVRLEQAGKLHCVITQNIDGLHSLAELRRGQSQVFTLMLLGAVVEPICYMRRGAHLQSLCNPFHGDGSLAA